MKMSCSSLGLKLEPKIGKRAMQHSGRNQAISGVKDAMKELKMNKEIIRKFRKINKEIVRKFQ